MATRSLAAYWNTVTRSRSVSRCGSSGGAASAASTAGSSIMPLLPLLLRHLAPPDGGGQQREGEQGEHGRLQHLGPEAQRDEAVADGPAGQPLLHRVPEGDTARSHVRAEEARRERPDGRARRGRVGLPRREGDRGEQTAVE